MCATKTQNIPATLEQVRILSDAGADIIRIAIDSKRDVDALAEIRSKSDAVLSVDLQENYRLIEQVAPLVDKVRYNPGHLHHHQKEIPVSEKVKFIVSTAREHDIALRIGVNFGSLDPALSQGEEMTSSEVALQSAAEHVSLLEELGFTNYVVSLKSSNPNSVIDINKAFSERFPFVPLHLGVTEAGMLPMGEIKSRVAFENLLALGIGDTLRVSLTLPFADKWKEIQVGRAIIDDVYQGRFRSVPRFEQQGLNIISCPSCSRVENEAFVELAEKVRDATAFASEHNITIAVMGCRVNGPGETDDADLGLWCAPRHVNLKRGEVLLGAFSYEEIVPRLLTELNDIISSRA
jgi:(E)-4-hydroxy-3-methylbut-2-enyl-diphosphate synthase